MLKHQFLAIEKLIELEPHGPLSVQDFEVLAEVMRQEVSHGRQPHGVLVIAEALPGWKNLDALSAQIEFIRANHEFLRRIAIVSDDVALRIFVEKCIAPLIRPEVKLFAATDRVKAKTWAAAK